MATNPTHINPSSPRQKEAVQTTEGQLGIPGRQVNRFGALIDAIYEHSSKEAVHLVYFTNIRLVKATPRFSGTLQHGWRSGSAPNDYIFPEKRKKNAYPEPTVEYPRVPKGRRNLPTYYIWNNTRYLGFVNDGIAGKAGVTPNSRKNINFIQRALAEGRQNAQKIDRLM